ncbi:hypothetical protein KP509_02G072000 [Ceratopteris richardii]|uniref:Pentatricopeptide repeat-containing protein n=1 Tax=Ceratopteris richardii TaxID=49495 RepID=A0A8T2VAP6_CERRI|nr:hypothetical protein KP509_02G072000 [Ceratopteris richardii]KAH7444290.1 hypothetical protein KP509_02G072000 [Ceratopteris richardii]
MILSQPKNCSSNTNLEYAARISFTTLLCGNVLKNLTAWIASRDNHHLALPTSSLSPDRKDDREETLFIQSGCGQPSRYKLISGIRLCSHTLDLADGRRLHQEACKKGFILDKYVNNTLVYMYGKCGAFSEAEEVFCSIPRRTTVSWNVMLSAYLAYFQWGKVLLGYRQMQEHGPNPDAYTLFLALQACGMLQSKEGTNLIEMQPFKTACFEIIHAFHAAVLEKGLANNPLISNTLVRLYGKCGALADAVMVFSGIIKHCVVSWTAMLASYKDNGQAEMALHCYRQMQVEGSIPDKVSYTIAFQACGIIAEGEDATFAKERLIKLKALSIGLALHADACGMDIAEDTRVGTSIVTMYGKCGAVTEAEEAFSALSCQDVVAWNAMLSVYIEQNDGLRVLHLYSKMREQHVPVDYVTLICALQGCCEQGSIHACEELHFETVCIGQGELSSLSAKLIHTYGIHGCMVSAQSNFDGLVNPDLVSWSVLVSGYANSGDDVMTLEHFASLQMARILPDDGIFASILLACSHSGLVLEGIQCFQSMIEDYKAAPKLMHYGVMCDLFGRAGEFRRAQDILARMPMKADLGIWWFLMGACQTHVNVELAEEAFEHAVNLQPNQATAYILMSYVYAAAGLFDHIKMVEDMRHCQGLLWSELD